MNKRADMNKWVLLLFVLLCTGKLALTQDVWNQITKIADEERAKNGMPGVSVAVVKGGQVVWTANLGYADPDRRTSTSSDTVYGIGSISKVFAGAAMMYVRDQGKLAIDDPVSRFVELPVHSRFPDSPPLTFRMLANHTAGLPYIPPLPFAYGNQFDGTYPFPSRDEMAASLSNADLLFAPNTRYVYSSLGFDLLALGVEKAANLRFENLVEEKLLKQLGMNSTGFAISPEMRTRLAVGYWPGAPGAILTKPYPNSDEPHGKAPLVFPPAASGGLFSSTSDLARFIASQLPSWKGAQPLRQATVREMQWNRLGWERGDRGDYTIFEHYGGTSGYSGYMGIVPELDFGIVVLTNISFRDLAIATRIIDAIIPAMKAEQEKQKLAQATALMSKARQFAGKYTVVNKDVLRYSVPGDLVLTLEPNESSIQVKSNLIAEIHKVLPTFPERTEFVPLTSTEFLIRGNCFHMSWAICEGDTVRFSKNQEGQTIFTWGALVFRRLRD